MQREGHSGLWNPQDNLPENLKDVKEQFHVVKDEKGYALTHLSLIHI